MPIQYLDDDEQLINYLFIGKYIIIMDNVSIYVYATSETWIKENSIRFRYIIILDFILIKLINMEGTLCM